jgi:hypothetical protein
MRYSEFSYRHLTKRTLFNVATLFVPCDRVEQFIATVALYKGRIIKSRVLPRSQGYSVDVDAGNPRAAADMLLAWYLQNNTTP